MLHKKLILINRLKQSQVKGFGLGVLIGMIPFRIGGILISIDNGRLLAGLFFGWRRSVHPSFAALPVGVSGFLRSWTATARYSHRA